MAIGQLRGDRPRGVELDAVALVIVDRQRQHAEARLARQRGADHRIEPARQQDDRLLHSFTPKRGSAQKVSA